MDVFSFFKDEYTRTILQAFRVRLYQKFRVQNIGFNREISLYCRYVLHTGNGFKPTELKLAKTYHNE